MTVPTMSIKRDNGNLRAKKVRSFHLKSIGAKENNAFTELYVFGDYKYRTVLYFP